VQVSAQDDPEGFALQLADPRARVVLGREDLDARLDDLAQLLSARPDAVAAAEQIDLRFADQAVLRDGPAREGWATTAVGRGRGTPPNGRPAG